LLITIYVHKYVHRYKMQTFSIADARSQLPKIIHAVESGNVTQFTRRGKPVAILLSPKEYENLLSQGQGSLLQAFNAYHALKEPSGDDHLSDMEIDSWRDKETGREWVWE